ncbi:MAG: hydrogenase maturation protease [Deltaproteobacteria bacterium]|nr:hydrogenase maturation protease [Deltaproteobacteria bacterium]
MIADVAGKAVVICGCGNILFGDDGFGPAVIHYLREHYTLPAQVLALDAGTSVREILFDLALDVHRPRRLIIVDAVDYPDRRPGEVFTIPLAGIPPKKTADFSLHQFPSVNILQDLLEHTDMDITILVAQAQSLPEEVHPGLSPPVQDAVATASRWVWQDVTTYLKTCNR